MRGKEYTWGNTYMKRNTRFSEYLENNARRVYRVCKRSAPLHLSYLTKEELNLLESSLPRALRILGEDYERIIYKVRKGVITNASPPYLGGSAVVRIPISKSEIGKTVYVCEIHMFFLDWSFIKSTGAKNKDFNEFFKIVAYYFSYPYQEELKPGIPIISCDILNAKNVQRDAYRYHYNDLKYRYTRKAIKNMVEDPYVKKHIKSKAFMGKKVDSILGKRYLHFKDFVLAWVDISELSGFDEVKYTLIPREGREVIVLDGEESRCLDAVVTREIKYEEYKNTTIREVLKKYVDRIIREGRKC